MRVHYYFLSVVQNTHASQRELENLFLQILERIDCEILALKCVVSQSPHPHIHAIIVTPKTVTYRRILRRKHGYSLHISKLETQHDVKNVTEYIDKHDGEQIDLNFSELLSQHQETNRKIYKHVSEYDDMILTKGLDKFLKELFKVPADEMRVKKFMIRRRTIRALNDLARISSIDLLLFDRNHFAYEILVRMQEIATIIANKIDKTTAEEINEAFNKLIRKYFEKRGGMRD